MTVVEPARAVRRYDFRQSEGLDRAAMRAIRTLCETFSYRFSGTLTGQLGTTAQVRVSGVVQQSWSDVLAGLPDPTCVLTAALVPLPARVVVQLPLELVAAWVELRLGGQVTAPLPRPLSDIERELLRPVVQALTGDLAAAAMVHHELHSGPVSILGDPQVQQALRGSDLCAAASLSVRIGEHEWPLLLCFPLVLLRPLLEDTVSESDGSELPPFWAMLDRLTDLPLDLQVRVGTIRLPAVALLDLAVGDVLRLPDRPGRPLRLMAGEQQFGVVRPVNQHGRLMAVIAADDDDEQTAIPLAGPAVTGRESA